MKTNVAPLRGLILQPIYLGDLSVTLLDVREPNHPGNWTFVPHMHPWFEFHYIETGGLYTTMEGVEFETLEGQFYLIPPGIVHSHRHYHGRGDQGLCLRMRLESCDRPSCSFPHADAILTALSTPSCRAFHYPVSQLLSLFPPVDLFSAQGFLVQLVLSLCSLCRPEEPSQNRSRSPQEIMVNQARLYLSQYFNQPIKVTDVAHSMNVSYRHLARIFKAATGNSLIQELTDLRMREAARLLTETALPVRQIALQVGYSSEYYFSTAFHQYYRVSPSAYRMQGH